MGVRACSHASNLDGFIVNAASPTAFKVLESCLLCVLAGEMWWLTLVVATTQFAAKKSLFLIPFLGWTARWGFEFVAIDRGNRYVSN